VALGRQKQPRQIARGDLNLVARFGRVENPRPRDFRRLGQNGEQRVPDRLRRGGVVYETGNLSCSPLMLCGWSKGEFEECLN